MHHTACDDTLIHTRQLLLTVVDPRLGEAYRVALPVEYGVVKLHEGISNNEEICLTLLHDVQVCDGSHAHDISGFIDIVVLLHKVVGWDVIIDSIYHESQSAEHVLALAVLHLRQDALEELVCPPGSGN